MRKTEVSVPAGSQLGSIPGISPVRTCIGCRKRDDQSVLMRVVARVQDGGTAVVLDEHRRLAGRGAWLHPRPACVEWALKRRSFNRAFRSSVTTMELESQLRTLWASSPEAADT